LPTHFGLSKPQLLQKKADLILLIRIRIIYSKAGLFVTQEIFNGKLSVQYIKTKITLMKQILNDGYMAIQPGIDARKLNCKNENSEKVKGPAIQLTLYLLTH
jgi:hypothetical protein